MSIDELKAAVCRLPLQERLELADFLSQQEGFDEAARHARIARRMRSMDGGRKITLGQMTALHQAMVNVGL